MNLREIYSTKSDKPVISFEIFPPKNDEDGEKSKKLFIHLELLKKYSPAFVSLTCGAGGTSQTFSLDLVKRLKNELNLTIMPHFTCVGTSKEQVRKYLMDVKNLGIKDILALRGDIPDGMEQKNFDFHYADELVKFIKSETDFSIGVAGYPEGHIECNDFEIDIKNLITKINSGADAVFTQMFFDNDKFLKFRELLISQGVEIPIIPGVLPIRNFCQLNKMLSMAKVSVPPKLMTKLEKFKESPEDIKKIGIEFASEQCAELITNGVKGLHFFTLNVSSSVSQILDNLDY